MKNDNRKKGKFNIWLSIPDFILGFIMLSLASSEKDSWEYYLSSSHRSDVDMVSMLAVLFIIAGAAELIYGLVLLSSADETQTALSGSVKKGEVIELIEGEVIKKELDTENLTEWVTFRQKNGNMLRVYHELSDHTSYKVGDRGIVKTNDRKIVQYIPDQGNQEP